MSSASLYLRRPSNEEQNETNDIGRKTWDFNLTTLARNADSSDSAQLISNTTTISFNAIIIRPTLDRCYNLNPASTKSITAPAAPAAPAPAPGSASSIINVNKNLYQRQNRILTVLKINIDIIPSTNRKRNKSRFIPLKQKQKKK